MDKKIGLLIVGVNGAIASTAIAGVEAIKRNLAKPTGLLTETEAVAGVDLVKLSNVKFGGWDIVQEPHFQCLRRHGILEESLLIKLENEPYDIDFFNAPRTGITNHILNIDNMKNISGVTVPANDAVKQIIDNINEFRDKYDLAGCVVVNLSSTEPRKENLEFINTIELFEDAINKNNPDISSGMIYAYASIKAHAPFINFTPSATVDIPALKQLAERERVAIAGNDGKTGQTLYKTVIAPMLKWRNLKLLGWYSTNILGNNDGRVLEDPSHKKTKIMSKTKVLDNILGYDDFYHRVEINYYPPRGDAKEAWDTIDFQGWLGTNMSMKINWIGEDSILAAPLVVDIMRLLWSAYERGTYGVVCELAEFFKDPIDCKDHDFSNQILLLQKFIETLKDNN